MANFSGTIYSKTLDMRTHLNIVTPKDILDVPDNGKIVYLLHGLSDDADAWLKNAQLPLLANDYNLTFVLPEVQRSFYTDMAYGLDYFTYVTEELPKICKRLFGLSDKREDNYVMGLSMGGYGALKCALKKPEQYAGCAAFSALTDLHFLLKQAREDFPRPEHAIREIKAVFGQDYELMEENDLYRIAKECEKNPLKPRIFMACGTEDFLHEINLQFRDFMSSLDFDYTYQEWAGIHEWYLWNKALHLACGHFFPRYVTENYCNIK
ncbi:alpha/beta hydrolase [Massiliimalia massiliensis]|uniref:alpha/beta hydrolase n=1 Tax=Massiliimalia massiliensis TaxID=1852384 RepID=UPI000986C6B4|nr:alpha/beta hydrolase family protein [Massiliimalia massiliensis]